MCTFVHPVHPVHPLHLKYIFFWKCTRVHNVQICALCAPCALCAHICIFGAKIWFMFWVLCTFVYLLMCMFWGLCTFAFAALQDQNYGKLYTFDCTPVTLRLCSVNKPHLNAPLNMKLAVATLWPITEKCTQSAQSAPGASPKLLMQDLRLGLLPNHCHPVFAYSTSETGSTVIPRVCICKLHRKAIRRNGDNGGNT
jgi:hypothetical protein